MNIKIENYRGFEIYFDNSNETFNCLIDDSNNVKKSYSSIKKVIDDFVKESLNFEPFMVETNMGESVTKIIGIRKDNRFITENAAGEKGQMSEYYENSFYLINDDNKPIYERYWKLDKEVGLLQEEMHTLTKVVTGTKLSDFKKTLLK